MAVKPSGFAMKSYLSDDLCDFLEIERGSTMARTEVTKKMIEYIKRHDLEDRVNRRNINPDDNLLKVVGSEAERAERMEKRYKEKGTIIGKQSPKEQLGNLSYFNIQAHLNHHFLGAAPTTGTIDPVVDLEEKMKEWKGIVGDKDDEKKEVGKDKKGVIFAP